MSWIGTPRAAKVLGVLGTGVVCGLGAPPAGASTTPVSTSAISVSVQLHHVFTVAHRTVAIEQQGFLVQGEIKPAVPGQLVAVRVLGPHGVVKAVKVHLKRSGASGYFSVPVRSPVSGPVKIVVLHQATAQLDGFAYQRRLDVLSDHATLGSRGSFVKLIQQRLAALHFYIRQTGVYDSSMALAVDAYHRLMGWGTSHSLDPRAVTALLRGQGSFPVRFAGHGRHAEADLSKQLLALVDGRRVLDIFPISSGKPSTPTILGNYQIYYRVPGYLPDGMYYSDFFIRGYAIHGYNPAPDYPASHGCLRLPISDAIFVYNWLAIGDWVDVYR
jgi:hypothetical protein